MRSNSERELRRRQIERRQRAKIAKSEPEILEQTVFGWTLRKILIGAPVAYTVFSFAFSYGVAFGISWEMPKLLTISDFFRIALPHAALMLPVLALPVMAFSMNAASALFGEEHEQQYYRDLRRRATIFLFALPFILFSVSAVLNIIFLSETVEFLGTDNPLGTVNVSIGAFMIFGPLMIMPIIVRMERISIGAWTLLCSMIVVLTFFVGNFVGILKVKGYDSEAQVVVKEGERSKLVLIIDDYVVVRQGEEIIALPKSDAILLKNN